MNQDGNGPQNITLDKPEEPQPHHHQQQPQPPTYRRPGIQRPTRRVAPPFSTDRFQKEVLSGRLWHRSCQDAARSELVDEVPLHFSSVDDYIATFDPLVLEEAREGLKADWAESCSASKMWPVDIQRVEDVGGGWWHLKLSLAGTNKTKNTSNNNLNSSAARYDIHTACPPNSVVVLTQHQPPQRNTLEWAQGGGQKEQQQQQAVKHMNDNRSVWDRLGQIQPLEQEGKEEPTVDVVEHADEDNVIVILDTDEEDNDVHIQQINDQGPPPKRHRTEENTGTATHAEPAMPRIVTEAKELEVSLPESSFTENNNKDNTNNQAAGCGIVAGIVLRSKDGTSLRIKIHPQCSQHIHQKRNTRRNNTTSTNDGEEESSGTIGTVVVDGDECDMPCCAVLSLLRSKPKRWWLAASDLLVTSEREYEALHKVRGMDYFLLQHLLQPKLLQEIGKHYEDHEVRRRRWPASLAVKPFIDKLKATFDRKQLEAIEMAACHLGSSTSRQTLSSPLLPSSSSSSHTYLVENASLSLGAAAAVPPTLPFILVQGPPGTGKTHAVRGILNVWHLDAFSQYQDALIRQLQPHSSRIQQNSNTSHQLNAQGVNGLEAFGSINTNKNNNTASSSLSSASSAVASISKPRILVCTPSNAACDEIMSRIMSQKFVDRNGNTYAPSILRVAGATTQVDPGVQAVLLKSKIEGYVNMAQAQWQQLSASVNQALLHSKRELHALELSMKTVSTSQQHLEIAKLLITQVDKVQYLERKAEKLEAVRDIVWGGRRNTLNRVREELELSFVSEAEMVFTTLSSTQRRVFKSIAARVPFHTVLIDEAGQASEVAALQALILGARQVVLVGDPQQLPATIISEAARAVAMGRSLFERLQLQGCPVTMLEIQYRMHKDIRSFPSRHFYGNRLQDAPQVAALPPEVFYSHKYMQPYLVFDVSRGVEQRSNSAGGSLSNKAEAEMAAALFFSLQNFLRQVAASLPPDNRLPPVSVAIITPYREQRRMLRETFQRLGGGPSVLKKVAIETVDSYQGRQMDVVILSCVRSGTNSGLGFVNDVRRMNVAITRARRALWVLGSAATLRNNPEWRALLSDAEERGLLIHHAHAQDLFPDLPCWQHQQPQQQPPQTSKLPDRKQGMTPAAGAEGGDADVEGDERPRGADELESDEDLEDPALSSKETKGHNQNNKGRQSGRDDAKNVNINREKRQFPGKISAEESENSTKRSGGMSQKRAHQYPKAPDRR